VEQLPQKPEPAPAPKTESPTPARPRKAKPSRLLPALKWIVVIGIMGAALFYVRMDVRVAGEFVVLPNPDSDARASVEGIVEEINVNEGSSVRKGELLARLADTDLRAELAKTQALAEQARAKLKLLQVGPTSEEIAVAKSGVARSEDTLKYARSRVERNQPLFQKKIVSAKDFEDMQEQVTAAENAVKEAASKLALLVKGTRPEDIHAAEAELARCEAQRAYIETQLSMLEIRSPARGVVATPSRQLMELKHQYVKRGDLIARVYDLSKMTADIIVSEKEIADVKPGQKVYIRTRAYPGMTFEGTVQKIAISAQGGAAPGASAGLAAGAPANGKTILVTTDIDNSTLLLKPGMTGEAKIIGSERTLFDLLTRRLVRTVKVEFWSWW
jgi:putative peptide zinc metalloprotease protein